MIQFTTDSIIQGLNNLILALDETPGSKLDPVRFERSARAITACLKALQEIEDYNCRAAQKINDTEYTPYEDLPPLSPEDQARFKSELFRIYNKVRLDGGPNGKLSEPSRG